MAWCMVLALTSVARQAGAERSVHRLGPGTPFETNWVRIDSGLPGPTVLVIGGVHGDEPAGARAAEQIASWTVARGALIVLPRANAQALAAGQRRTPDAPRSTADLNRCFPREPGRSPLTPHAAALWDLVRQVEPALLLDLHEGYDFAQSNPKSVGSSIIHPGTDEALRVTERMLAAVNAEVEDPTRSFVPRRIAVVGSLARAAADRLGVTALIVETTTKDQSLPLRVREHRLMVHAALAALDMAAHGPHVLHGEPADARTRVALYAGAGAAGQGVPRFEGLLTADPRFIVRSVHARDVRDGALDAFDVVLFPGGSGSGQARALGEAGRAVVREFVRDGGGFVGVCAGGYLAAANYEWSLGILDADVIDREHWKRGTGSVPIELERELLERSTAESDAWTELRYANGPIWHAAGRAEVPDFEVLATWRGEVLREGIPRGVMPGAPALVRGAFGAGRVVCCSGHPEWTPGLESLAVNLVALAAPASLGAGDGRQGASTR